VTTLIDTLKGIVGPKGFLEGKDMGPRYASDVTGIPGGTPLLVVRPANTGEVSKILAACFDAGQPVLTQGGNTGLVQGGVPEDREIVLSLERMNQIEEFDEAGGTMTVQAGTILQTIQETAEEKGLTFPLDLGARGSCTIGGNISTNAGGNRVIRYGMTRELVLGLEAVLADGTVINSLHKLVKNNTGYDLKHMFVGSEGTLGVVTRAVLKLVPVPSGRSMALCGVDDFQSVVALLRHMKASLGATLSAFEVMWRNYYDATFALLSDAKHPFEARYPFYVLIESMGIDDDKDREAMEEALGGALEEGMITDAIIAKSTSEMEEVWKLRDASLEVAMSLMPIHAYDISLPVTEMAPYFAKMDAELAERWPDHKVIVFGHLGDGNLHIVINDGVGGKDKAEVNQLIYGLAGSHQGSISAEHGIGLQKRSYLAYSRSPEEITLMKTLKKAMDPKNILNHGRIFESSVDDA
jgi:FAD/FMN-containing dehydrogenase